MTYFFAIAAFVLAFVVMCQWCRNRDLETEVGELKKANLQLTEENAGYDSRIATLIEGYKEELRQFRADYEDLASISASQLIEIVELESRCDALANPARRMDMGQAIYN